MVGKGIHQFSGARINGVQETSRSNKDAAVRAILTLPVITPALAGNPAVHAEATGKLVHPKFFARRRIQCDQGALFSRYISNVIDYQRTECVISLVAGWIAPGKLEFVYVLNVNLLQRR